MNKDLLKGLMMVGSTIVAVCAVFFVVSDSGPQKAECIASALKAGVAYANIGHTCNLTKRGY